MGKCVDCGKYIKGEGLCYDCQNSGKSKNTTDYQCAFEDNGSRCNKQGSIAFGLNTKDKWYCSWHHHCITNNISPKNQEAYLKHKAKMDKYREKYSAQKATPEQIARFLIKAGSKSIYWEKASEGVKQYTINYAKTKGIKRQTEPSPEMENMLQI